MSEPKQEKTELEKPLASAIYCPACGQDLKIREGFGNQFRPLYHCSMRKKSCRRYWLVEHSYKLNNKGNEERVIRVFAADKDGNEL